MADENKRTVPRGTYRRVVSHIRPYWRGLAGTFAFGLAGSGFTVLQPWPVKFIIDGVLVGNKLSLGPLGVRISETSGQRLTTVAWLAGAYFCIVVSSVLCSSTGMYLVARVALHMIHDLRGQLVAHMRKLSLRFHASQSVGDSIWRAINDVRSIQEVVGYGIGAFSVPLFRLVLMVGLMAVLDPVLTLVAMLVAPFFVLAMRLITKKIQATSAESRDHMASLTTLIEQSLVAIRAVQVFGRESKEQDKFQGTSLRFVRAQLRFRTWEQILNIVTVVITGLGSASVLLLASQRVVSGSLSVGSLWIFVAYMQGLYNMVNQVVSIWAPFQDGVVGVSRAFQTLDEVPDIEEPEDAIEKTTFDAALTFRDVSFAYQPDVPVLDHVDFEVRRGETIAVVGETGSGKTTMLSLIPRLYDPTSGAVEVDGIPLPDLKVSSIRTLVSMVPQEPLLFSATIKENILYGKLDAEHDEVVAAATAARAVGFIEGLPMGYDTPVGERGVKLSTGQQQRISIARAFLKDAPILLLDEPTSALDLNTEADFLDGLADLMEGRTVFIVAHRLSTIRNADRILVLADGAIAEIGSHQTLMAAKGRYERLYQRQFGAAAPEPEPLEDVTA
ncbi:MAG TPA: ABC transporter ATP-binding protein [Acidimicrobiales bacterium]|nr:ABC transporter ATP-binding protein [Acidimicrobiales bacterium]